MADFSLLTQDPSGRGRGRGGFEGKVAETRRSLQRIIGSGDEGAIDKAARLAGDVGGMHLSTIGKALRLLDTPRAAVTAGVKEQHDLLSKIAAALGAPDSGREDGDVSLADFARNVRAGYGGGDLLRESTGGGTGNRWVDRGVGLGLDVGLDPLTFLTFGASAAAAGGGKVLSKADVVESLLKAGRGDAAARAGRRGAAAAGGEALRDVGVTSGALARIPFTQTAAEVPGTSKLAELLAATFGEGRAQVADSKVGQALARLFSPAPEVGRMMRSGDPAKVAAAVDVPRAHRAARGVGRGLHGKLLAQLDQIAREHRGVDPDVLRQEVESGVRTPAADALRGWLVQARALANEATEGVFQLPEREQYLPHQLTDEVRDLFADEGRLRRRGGQGDHERQRRLVPGAEFLGRELETGSIDEINEILAESLPADQYVQMFRTDPWEIAHRYADTLARSTAKHRFDKELLDRGVTQRPDMVMRTSRSRVPAWVAEALGKDELQRVRKQRPTATVLEQRTPAGTVPVSPHRQVRYAPKSSAEAITQLREAMEPQRQGGFLRAADRAHSLWKAYQLATPGFHIRNVMGAAFNNHLAGLDPKWYRTFAKNYAAFKKGGLEAVDPKYRDAFDAMERYGQFTGVHGRDIGDLSDSDTGLLGRRLRSVDPTSQANRLLDANRRVGERVERSVRGPLFLETYVRSGGDVDAALERVASFHFDYDELSAFEKAWGKRLFSFYTWSRKNAPLQLAMIARKPAAYTAHLKAQRAVEGEDGAERDSYVPEYYGDLLGIRLPVDNDGNPMYLTADMPYRDLAETLSPQRLLGQLSPAFKLPLEMVADRQMYTGQPFRPGLEEAPRAWLPLTKALSLLPEGLQGRAGLPAVVEGADGSLLMSQKDAYKVEQTIPLVPRLARRLFPSEEKFDRRHLGALLSTLGGLGTQTLDDSARYGEAARRAEMLSDLVASLRARGLIVEGA